MQHKTRTIPTLIFVAVLFYANSLTFAATVYDDFNGSSIDTLKWLVAGPSDILSQSGGLLHADISLPPDPNAVMLKAKESFQPSSSRGGQWGTGGPFRARHCPSGGSARLRAGPPTAGSHEKK